MIKISTLGGYNEVGKNMTAVRVNDDVIILDMGLHIENYIRYTEDEDVFDISAKDLLREDAIPDIAPMEDWKDKVKAIIPTHAHLDHVGALPFLSNRFKAPILCTPYTKEVINAICRDDKIKLKNEIKALTSNSIYHINDNIKIEFINITHSTPQTVMVALHTKEGTVLYANDFKFDNYPVLGKKPDITKLESLKNVKALVCDSTRAEFRMKTPSESVAREMLRDVMDIPKKGAMIATTFSSHLARLKTIMSFATQIKRKPIFMGRSLSKYIEAGEKIGLINFS